MVLFVILFLFLCAEVTCCSHGLVLKQTKYILELLAKENMLHAKHVSTPVVPGSLLSLQESTPLTDGVVYPSIVGRLQNVIMTRQDISFAINQACQFMHFPTTSHLATLSIFCVISNVLAKWVFSSAIYLIFPYDHIQMQIRLEIPMITILLLVCVFFNWT